MDRDDVIQALTTLLEEIKDYGVPYRMTDYAHFKIVCGLESLIETAIENEEDEE